MNEPLYVDLFVEDRAHEVLLRPLLLRLAREQAIRVAPRVRTARGGHSRVLAELKNYQLVVERRGLAEPDLLVVAADANCSAFARARLGVAQAVREALKERTIIACPDPHIERWYLADPQAFHDVVGVRPRVRKRKCERGICKRMLADAVIQAGHPPTLGGIEFAADLVGAMDLYRAAKAEPSLKHFIDDTRAHFKRR